MSHAYEKLHWCKDKNADDIATEYTEEAMVSETRIDVREELFEGKNDEYLDNEMLEPCISEEEISEDDSQGQKDQLPCDAWDCRVSEKSEYSGLGMNITVANEEKGKERKIETKESFLVSEHLDKIEKKTRDGRDERREGLEDSSTENLDKKDEFISFDVPTSCSVKIEVKQWKEVYSGRVINKRNEKVLTRTWVNWLAGILADIIPSCNIAFKRHKLYAATSENVTKCWFNCTIEGCRLDSQAILDKSCCLHVNNKNISLIHVKGKPKSFQSRYISGKDREKLGKSVSGMTYCSKFFHEKLNSLDERSFSMGNLKDIPISKNVISQCSYEYRRKNQKSESVVESVQLLKKAYNKELDNKFVPGFIQFIFVNPLTIALWSEKGT